MQTPEVSDLGQGIYCIDTGLYRPRMVACYLVRAGDEAAFIDTGTAPAAPRLLAALEAQGLTTAHVRYVIPTHVHLDHAGAAGELMRLCPGASLVAHPRSAPHLVDPSKLMAGATAVYGEEAFARDFGTLTPVPEDRVILAPDGFELDMNGRAFTFFDTPGHANHHFCVFDHESRGFFTGDTFGISYRDFDSGPRQHIFAPTTPVGFDPEGWQASLDRLLEHRPRAMYLTHFGRVVDVDGLAERLRASIRRFAAIALVEQEPKEGRQARIQRKLREDLLRDLRDLGCMLSEADSERLLAIDLDLNAQGLEVWLRRREKSQAQAS